MMTILSVERMCQASEWGTTCDVVVVLSSLADDVE